MTGQKNTKSKKNRGEHKITQKRATKGKTRNNKKYNKSTQQYAYTNTNTTKNNEYLPRTSHQDFVSMAVVGTACIVNYVNGLSELYFAGCSPHIRKVWLGHYFIS